MAKLIFAISLLGLSGCATSMATKTLRNMAIAGAAGAIIGSQQPAYKSTQAALLAGIGASVVGAGTLLMLDQESRDLTKENERLRAELDAAFEPKAEAATPGTMNAKVPAKYQNLISPGEWRVYQIDEWVEDGENRMIHQDKVMELIPPSLRPYVKPTRPKGKNP